MIHSAKVYLVSMMHCASVQTIDYLGTLYCDLLAYFGSLATYTEVPVDSHQEVVICKVESA